MRVASAYVTSAHRKKQVERIFLERFIDASGLVAEIVAERENPDFLVRFEGRLVGIEVTRLFVSHDNSAVLPQAQESISDRIAFRARQLYEDSGAWPAHVSVSFSSRQDFLRINRNDTANALAAIVSGMNLSEWKRVDWCPGYPDPLASVVSFVHALGVPTREMAHWSVVRAGWVAPLTVDLLQLRINEKAARLSEYRNHVRENWLLVFADGMQPSQLFGVRDGFDPSKIVSPFDRTYFCGHPEGAAISLGHAGARQQAV